MLKLIKVGQNKIADNLEFCFDGCHKIYIMTSEEEKREMIEKKNWNKSDFHKIAGINLESCYINTCPLRFISYGANKKYKDLIRQCATRATFTYKDTITNEIVKHIVDNNTGLVETVRG